MRLRSSCATDKGDTDAYEVSIISDGQTPTLKRKGCSR